MRRLLRSRTAWILAGIMLAALGLRLWSFRHGLPWVYNRDEETHFVPVAVRMFGGDFNPHYFENPPALTYLFYAVFRLRFGAEGFRQSFATDPTAAYETARIVVALLGVLGVGLVYEAGRRWFDRRAGLVAAALLAFCFLPAFYGKFALNDVVTMAPVAITLAALVLVWERGNLWMWALAGASAGTAAAVKYTAGALAVPIALAALLRWRDERDGFLRAVLGLTVAGVAFGVVFAALNPYAIADFSEFRSQVGGQSATAGGSAKLGQADVPGWLYYLWTLTWGLGVLPLLAALAGAWFLIRADWRRAVILLVFPLLLFVFLGFQARYFGRWFLPAYPAIAILAGYGVVRIAGERRWLVPVLGVLLVLQGLASVVRVDSVLAHTDSREIARSWVVRNIPAGAGIVVEPFVPSGWLDEGRYREWEIKPPFQAYEKKLVPEVIDEYRTGKYCWVVVGSHQKERGLKAGLAGAKAYYARLDSESERTLVLSPFRPDAAKPGFNFDMSFNYYPRAHARPGPVVEIHRLRDCG